MANITDRLKRSWNAFFSRDPTDNYSVYRQNYFVSSSRPDRFRLTPTNGSTIVATIYNRIALDVSNLTFIHARMDYNKRYVDDINSDLYTALTLSPNLDQTANAFFQDLVLSLFDEGCIAVCPIDTSINPSTGSFDIQSLRIGKIKHWFPDKVRVEVYNERSGKKEELNFPKRTTAILENPFYAVMNDHNSTKERLVHKMALLDKLDNASASNKLDLIIQLPYLTKSPAQKRRAEDRIKDLENQLQESPLGIAYSDGTEKIVQLNRSITNNLADEVKQLQSDLFDQLGLTESILKGTATSDQLVIYYDRTIEPICEIICDEFTRKFLSKTAITQGQRIIYYRDPFKLTTLTEIATASDSLIPNQIVTANEIRTGMGLKPSDQPQADQLVNPNINTIDTINKQTKFSGDNIAQDEDASEDSESDNSQEHSEETSTMKTPVSMLDERKE